jgi:hypothetical protein
MFKLAEYRCANHFQHHHTTLLHSNRQLCVRGETEVRTAASQSSCTLGCFRLIRIIKLTVSTGSQRHQPPPPGGPDIYQDAAGSMCTDPPITSVTDSFEHSGTVARVGNPFLLLGATRHVLRVNMVLPALQQYQPDHQWRIAPSPVQHRLVLHRISSLTGRMWFLLNCLHVLNHVNKLHMVQTERYCSLGKSRVRIWARRLHILTAVCFCFPQTLQPIASRVPVGQYPTCTCLPVQCPTAPCSETLSFVRPIRICISHCWYRVHFRKLPNYLEIVQEPG